MEASWAILAALVASQVRLGGHLGDLGRLGERQGRVLAPTEPRKEGAMHAGVCDRQLEVPEDFPEHAQVIKK